MYSADDMGKLSNNEVKKEKAKLNFEGNGSCSRKSAYLVDLIHRS